MADWSEGYVTDINYTNGFYQELSPVWLTATATLLGYRAPSIERPYAYAELGCGQGFGIGLLAATNPSGRFYGFDFNPAQIAHGQGLAEASGLDNIELHDLSFQQLAASADSAWPGFDFIVLHGIYSWVNRDNQLAILEFIRRFLKPGGLVYVSYNCTPGWASMVPLQRLMRQHAASHPARSDVQGQQALAFIAQLQAAGAAFFQNHSDITPRLEASAKVDRHYIPHEYLNRDWSIIDFADMADDCTRAKLNYIGSATLSENLDNLSVPASLLPLLQAESDPVMRQTILDYASNKGFRRDIYQKGRSPLTAREHLDAVKAIRLTTLKTEWPGEAKFKTPLGEATGQTELYAPLIQALCEKPYYLSEITQLPAMAGKGAGDLIEIALLLIHGGYAHPALPETSSQAACRFNRQVCQAMLHGHSYAFLAAPSLGGGLGAGFLDMTAVLAMMDNPGATEAVFIDAVWRLLQENGRNLVKDGNTLESKEAATPELRSIYAVFQGAMGRLWHNLGVLPS